MGHIQTCVLASTFFVTYVRKRIDCEIHLMLEARQLHMLRDISHLFKFISVQACIIYDFTIVNDKNTKEKVFFRVFRVSK